MMIKIREHEFDYAVYDIDNLAKSEAQDEMLKAALNALGSDDVSPTLENQVAMYNAYAAFFDATLGKGSLKLILNGKRNVMDAIEAYYDLRDAVSDAMIQRANEVGARAKMPDKYNPDNIRN